MPGQSWWTNEYPSTQTRLVSIYLYTLIWVFQSQSSLSSILLWETDYFLNINKSFMSPNSTVLHSGLMGDCYPTYQMPLDNLHKSNYRRRFHINVKCKMWNAKNILGKVGLSELGTLLSLYTSWMLKLSRKLFLHTSPCSQSSDHTQPTEKS